MSEDSIDTLEAIAAAVAAWQINGNEYIKDKEWEPGVGNIRRWENREILNNYFRRDYYSEGSISPPLISITDEHRDIAEDIRAFSKKLLLKVLAAEPNSTDYEVMIYQKINQPTISKSDLGYIGSCPAYYYRTVQRDDLKRRLEETQSQHVGSIGGKVTLSDFEITRNHKSVNFGGYVVQGICDNNLFLFFSNKDLSYIRVGDKISLQGKIKDHIMEKDKYPMTKLNYVAIEGDHNETKIST